MKKKEKMNMNMKESVTNPIEMKMPMKKKILPITNEIKKRLALKVKDKIIVPKGFRLPLNYNY